MTGKCSSSSRNSRKCWWAVVFLIISTVLSHSVDGSSIVHREKREFVIPDWIEIVDEPSNDSLKIHRTVRVRETKVNYDGAQLWRVRASEKSNFESHILPEIQETGLFSMWSGNDSTVDMMVRQDYIQRATRLLKEKDIKFDVIIDDVQKAIDEENPTLSKEEMEELEGRTARYAWWQGVLVKVQGSYLRARPLRYPIASGGGGPWHFKGHRMEWSTYHRLEDIHGYLDYLAASFPHICSVMDIGTSVEGRPLKVIRISNGKEGAPALWIDGGIHAREWISPASVTYIIHHLVEVSDSLEADYYILPVVNPDGYEYTFLRDRLWRKNRKNYVTSPCTGVDLNRNFGYRWGGKGTSKDPCRDIFAGSAPFSEPETNAIKNFFEASAANFKAYLSFHSYGQYILYPWGYDRRVPPDYADLERVGREAATAMKKAGGAGSIYTVGNSATTLYAASGGSDDWAKAILKIKYTYTIELRDTGKSGFILPARYIVPTAKEALAAVEVVTQACKSA